MRVLSTDPSEPGVFAVGQVAYGVVALGQVAVGVVAVGQGAIGLVAIGQGAVGLYYGGAMLGVFGRGFPLALVPRFPGPRTLPDTTDLSQVRAGYGDGWIEATLGRAPSGVPALFVGDHRLEVRLQARLVHGAAMELDRRTSPRVVAHVRRIDDHMVCDRLMHVQMPPLEQPDFWTGVLVRTAALTAIAIPMVLYVVAPLFA